MTFTEFVAPLPAGPVRGAGAALPHRRLPDAAPDRPRGAPHPRARRPGRVARRDGAPDRLLAARRVGGAGQPERRAAHRGARPSENRALSANPRALRVMVRQSMFRRVELVSLGRYAALAALDGGLTAGRVGGRGGRVPRRVRRPGHRPAGAWPGAVPRRRGGRRPLGGRPRSSRTPTATATGGSPPSSTSRPPTRRASSCWSRPASAPPEPVRRRRPRSSGVRPAARGHRGPGGRSRRRPGRPLPSSPAASWPGPPRPAPGAGTRHRG